MTMQHQIHPDDERLAALAGGDADATADAGLRAHVSACDRCGPMVADLEQLRSALAELPDLVPSRRLQLVPPAPMAEPRPSGGWLRRLAAPLVAAGFVMVAAATVGGSGALSSMATGAGGAAAAPSAASSAGSSATGDRAGAPADERFAFPLNLFFSYVPARDQEAGAPELSGAGASQVPAPTDTGAKASEAPAATLAPSQAPSVAEHPVVSVSPWGVVLLLGAVFVVAGGVMLVTQPGRGP
jgi:hypothetical protein